MAIGGKTSGERVLNSRKAVTKMFLLGFLLAVIGYVTVASSWPSTSMELTSNGGFDVQPVHHGSTGGVFTGAALLGIGQIFMLISMVAWGVRYGIESAVPNRSLTEADFTPPAVPQQ